MYRKMSSIISYIDCRVLLIDCVYELQGSRVHE